MIQLIKPLPLVAEVDANSFDGVHCEEGKIVTTTTTSDCKSGTTDDPIN